jgi:hypothetical protein
MEVPKRRFFRRVTRERASAASVDADRETSKEALGILGQD